MDPFAGSGTTAIAARALGHHFYAMELDPVYRETALRRLDSVHAGTRNGLDAFLGTQEDNSNPFNTDSEESK